MRASTPRPWQRRPYPDAKGHTDKLLERLDAEHTRAEVLDLRIAICGLAITVGGVLLGLFA